MLKVKALLSSLVLISIISAQNVFSGLSAWTHGGTVGYSGGGYLLSFQNENSAIKFRNMYTEVGWVRKLMLQSADLLTEMFVISGITLTLIFYDPSL